MSRTFVADALRRRVAETARFRCGYCLTSQQIIGPLLEIEHIIPVARGGSSEEENLFLACPRCNSHKGDRTMALDPDAGSPAAFFNPRTQIWGEHFEWLESGAMIRGKTKEGRATVIGLNMNHPDIVAARRLWCAAGWHPPSD
ncbi:MAG: HNH endonuclease [Polyangiaceae bacterium]|nr:HNH endonuclease [Polyangiaceae bacterium]